MIDVEALLDRLRHHLRLTGLGASHPSARYELAKGFDIVALQAKRRGTIPNQRF